MICGGCATPRHEEGFSALLNLGFCRILKNISYYLLDLHRERERGKFASEEPIGRDAALLRWWRTRSLLSLCLGLTDDAVEQGGVACFWTADAHDIADLRISRVVLDWEMVADGSNCSVGINVTCVRHLG